MSATDKGVRRKHRQYPLLVAAKVVPPSPPTTRYQGSKYKLLDWMWHHMSQLGFNTVLDAFGGSGCVSHFLKSHGKAVTYNDILVSNYLIGQALVANDAEQLTSSDVSFLLHRHHGLEYSDFIYSTFHDIYFTDEENRWLDVVAQNIPRLPTLNLRALAYYALFQAAISKRPYNLFHRKNLYMRMSDVRRSFGNKATWDKPFDEHFRSFVRDANDAVFHTGAACRSLNMDVLKVPGRYDLVYVDSPYVSRKGVGVDYYDFYHFLEGIADYGTWHNRIDYRSKHRRLKRRKSPWTDPLLISEAFTALFSRFADSTLVVSYRSDGIPSPEALVEMVREFKKQVSLHKLDGGYTYVLSKNRKSTEVLIIGKD